MTTAREQAREAARPKAQGEHPTPDQCADAASDVWEVLLNDLLNIIDGLPEHHTYLIQSEAYKRAQEAVRSDS